MGAAIWSSDPVKFLDFPMRFFADFFQNHGFLNVTDQPQWLVIKNGSRQYIEPLTQNYRDRIRLNCPVRSIRRSKDSVVVKAEGGEPEAYDRVVIAAHSDQAIAMLADPSDRERDILGNIQYQKNHTVLHTDHRILPEKRLAWASWNYLVSEQTGGRVAVTYNMNRLQGIRSNAVFCVSLNLSELISPEKTIAEYQYAHPVYTPESLAARRRYEEINGENRTFYCGAYWYNGFHEDGVKSALTVAGHFGKTL
jgi:predicted NAD/FAD-binding protein